jgi:hypothetical protein
MSKVENGLPPDFEPQTFAQRKHFLAERRWEWWQGRISDDSLWVYEQRYGYGRRTPPENLDDGRQNAS